MPLDGNAYRGLQGVMLWTVGVVFSDVRAVVTAFHVFYLSEALAKVKSGGSKGPGSFQDEGYELEFG